jgi:hypothetical protein
MNYQELSFYGESIFCWIAEYIGIACSDIGSYFHCVERFSCLLARSLSSCDEPLAGAIFQRIPSAKEPQVNAFRTTRLHLRPLRRFRQNICPGNSVFPRYRLCGLRPVMLVLCCSWVLKRGRRIIVGRWD